MKKEELKGKCFKSQGYPVILVKVTKVLGTKTIGLIEACVEKIDLSNFSINEHTIDVIHHCLEPIDSAQFNAIKERINSFNTIYAEEVEKCVEDINKIIPKIIS